jgi:hypothetical protein
MREDLALTQAIPFPPCCLPGWFKNITEPNGECYPFPDGTVLNLCATSPPTPAPTPTPARPCDIVLTNNLDSIFIYQEGKTQANKAVYLRNGTSGTGAMDYMFVHIFPTDLRWCVGNLNSCYYYESVPTTASTPDKITEGWIQGPGKPYSPPVYSVCAPGKPTPAPPPTPALTPTPAPAPGGQCPAGRFCPLLADPSATGGCATGSSDYPPVLAKTTTSSRAACEAKCAAAGAVCAAYQWCAIASDHGCQLMPAAKYTRQNGYPSTFCMKRGPFIYPTMP